MRRSRLLSAVFALVAGLALCPAPAVADAQTEDLERRVGDLEAIAAASGDGASWADHVRLGGSANTGGYFGRKNSVFHDRDFEIWDAALYVDAELGNAVRLGDHVVVRNAGMSFEWTVVRLGRERNSLGELFAEFQGLGDCGLLNLEVGRFQLPLGENYLRFSKGYRDNPFITNTVGGPWFWDEGIKLYGSTDSNLFTYVASVTEGGNPLNEDTGSGFQYTLKLITDPFPWLRASVSGMVSGKIGSEYDTPEQIGTGGGSLWMGETWSRGFGAGTSLPNYIHGSAEPDGPAVIDRAFFVGADLVVDLPDVARIWLAYGLWSLDQKGSLYDRDLHYWIAEVILRGALVARELENFYLGLRANALGTYDSGEGYEVDYRDANRLGWNVESQTAYSAVLGWHLLRHVTLRAEYTRTQIDLVRGVPRAIESQSTGVDSGGIEVGVSF